MLVVDPPKERAEPKVCPKPDPNPDEVAGAAVVVAAAAAGAAPNAVEPAAVVAAADPKAGAAELKGLAAVEAVVVAKTEEPVWWQFNGIILKLITK